MKKVIVYTDGGARGNPGPAGAGAYIIDEDGKELAKIHSSLGIRTNNWAEYEAIIEGLEGLKKLFGKTKLKEMDIEVRSDSELIIRQLNGQYQIKDESLCAQFIKVWNLRVALFPNITFTHVRREFNKEADALANEAMDKG